MSREEETRRIAAEREAVSAEIARIIAAEAAEDASEAVRAPALPPPPDELTPAFAADANAFAWDLHRATSGPAGNHVISPASVRMALAMVMRGAHGQTRDELTHVLRLADDDPAAIAAHRAMQRWLLALGDGAVVLESANRLWNQRGHALLDDYVVRLDSEFGAGIEPVDFVREPEAACATINGWVEERTRGRIGAILDSSRVDPNLRLVIGNATYFKGIWESQFRRRDTHPHSFHRPGRDPVETPFMTRTLPVRYARGEGFRIVELPYVGGEVVMNLLVPDEPDGLARLEHTLSMEQIAECIGRQREDEVLVGLPRFALRPPVVDLASALRDLGMPTVFDASSSDLSGIDGCAPPSKDALYVGAVLHRAMTEVDEAGTVAAAVTLVVSYV